MGIVFDRFPLRVRFQHMLREVDLFGKTVS